MKLNARDCLCVTEAGCERALSFTALQCAGSRFFRLFWVAISIASEGSLRSGPRPLGREFSFVPAHEGFRASALLNVAFSPGACRQRKHDDSAPRRLEHGIVVYAAVWNAALAKRQSVARDQDFGGESHALVYTIRVLFCRILGCYMESHPLRIGCPGPHPRTY